VTTDDLLRRALLFAALPGNTLAGAAARYGVTLAGLRRARTRLGRPAPTLDDLVLHGLERPCAPSALIPWIDYVNHARPDEAEVLAQLRRLAAAGLVRETEEGWVRRADWP
jgi:hypothetical protein